MLQPAELYKWGDSGGNFLHLAHVHCREHYEVKWYCEQLGISANTLTAVTKRLYGKTARMIIDELLLEEAKLALRNPDYSIQSVSDQLFSVTSLLSENSLNGAMVFRRLFTGVRFSGRDQMSFYTPDRI